MHFMLRRPSKSNELILLFTAGVLLSLALVEPALAKTRAGHKAPTAPTAPAPAPVATGVNDGESPIDSSGGGPHKQTGHIPQSLVPIGSAEEPKRQQFDIGQLMQAVRLSLVTMDKPANAASPEAQAVRATIQQRDARLAAKNLPKRVEVAGQ